MADLVEIPDVLRVVQVADCRYQSVFLAPSTVALDGGQLAGQALNAALDTVDMSYLPDSVHMSFIAAGDSLKPVDFEVLRDRDGRSFASRHIIAKQDAKLIFRMNAIFQVKTSGVDHQREQMPQVTAPEDCPILKTNMHGFEVRDPDPRSPLRIPAMAWVRPQVKLGIDQRANAAALLYASDLGSGLCDLVTPGNNSFFTSLDHALWFHRPVFMDEWVLVNLRGSSLASERAWFTGTYFTVQGTQVASSAQEMLYREQS